MSHRKSVLTRFIIPRRLRIILAAVLGIAATAWTAPALAAVELEVGAAAVDITPKLDSGEKFYLAGLEKNRVATGVHDSLFARALVLKAAERAIALVSVDSIGLQRPTIEAARRQLPMLDYVLVASTHTHAAPDCIGLWGPTDAESGVSDAYLDLVVQGIVESAKTAASATAPARAVYGIASDQSLLGDFRLPNVFDPVLRAVRFERLSDGKPCAVLVQWNAHGVEPRKNPLITRDFMGATVDELERRHGCTVVYFSGAIGGLMGTPNSTHFIRPEQKPVRDVFHFIELYGHAVADLADKALGASAPIELAPIAVSARAIAVPLDNAGYRMARRIGVLRRPAYAWMESREQLGEPLAADVTEGAIALESEVAYLRLGELHIAAIPGELYPELVYGQFQEPVDEGADYHDAPLEVPVMRILPGEKTLLFGLANDELGYIVPKRQWDVKPPFCYGRSSAQYGEVNSVGPETARMLTEALADRIRDASSN